MKDCHVHTNLSYDGKATMQEYIDVAPSKNVDEITFTEHYDISDGMHISLPNIDLMKYNYEYMKMKDYSSIPINFGLEVGLRPEHVADIQNEISKYPFDFIIGSSHTIANRDIGEDKTFFEEFTQHEAYMLYFNEVLKNVELYDDYDVYGHLDYIIRYGNYANKNLNYKDYQEILDAILYALIKKDKGLEVNSSAYRFGNTSPHPNIEILKKYKEYGGKILTIGSDAHKSRELARDLDLTLDAIESCGFDEICVFHKRKPDFVKVKNLKR